MVRQAEITLLVLTASSALSAEGVTARKTITEGAEFDVYSPNRLYL
jgi:hypothetical protein